MCMKTYILTALIVRITCRMHHVIERQYLTPCRHVIITINVVTLEDQSMLSQNALMYLFIDFRNANVREQPISRL